MHVFMNRFIYINIIGLSIPMPHSYRYFYFRVMIFLVPDKPSLSQKMIYLTKIPVEEL